MDKLNNLLYLNSLGTWQAIFSHFTVAIGADL